MLEKYRAPFLLLGIILLGLIVLALGLLEFYYIRRIKKPDKNTSVCNTKTIHIVFLAILTFGLAFISSAFMIFFIRNI